VEIRRAQLWGDGITEKCRLSSGATCILSEAFAGKKMNKEEIHEPEGA
jgi:hypothetical protein